MLDYLEIVFVALVSLGIAAIKEVQTVVISAFAYMHTTMLNNLGTTGVLITMAWAFVIYHYSLLKHASRNWTMKCKELDDEVQRRRKLTKDKAASAEEVATLKSRCEEGDEKIRKLTMDKETLAKEVATLKRRVANMQLLWKRYMQLRADMLRADSKCEMDDVAILLGMTSTVGDE
jgi:hypothetical protein